jgi:hypothetical protein
MAKLVIPNIFTPGTPAQASQMNANFEAVANWTASGQVTTDSIQIPLGFRSNNDQGQSQPILQFLQQNDDPILDLINNNGESSIVINQLQALDAGSAVILIEDNVAQSQATSAALKMILSSNANSPAILISHGTETLSLTKSEFKLINSTFKVNATQMLIPRVTTGNRPAAAEEGSVLYNSTTKQLNEKRAASGKWAPVGAPVGSIVMWPTATLPEGWVWCNGEAIANGSSTVHAGTANEVTADFSALYAVVGANLPNFVGLYPRGAQMSGVTQQVVGADTYNASAVNTKQEDWTAVNGLVGTVGNPDRSLDHRHKIWVDDPNDGWLGAPEESTNRTTLSDYVWPDDLANLNQHKHSLSLTGNDETRPATFSVGFIIKY